MLSNQFFLNPIVAVRAPQQILKYHKESIASWNIAPPHGSQLLSQVDGDLENWVGWGGGGGGGQIENYSSKTQQSSLGSHGVEFSSSTWETKESRAPQEYLEKETILCNNNNNFPIAQAHPQDSS